MLRFAEKSERVILMNHGRQVAALLPIEDLRKLERIEKDISSPEDIMLAVDAMVKADIKIHTIILFGSYARGDARSKSDVDLLVISEGIQNFWKESSKLSWAASEFVPAEILLTEKSSWSRLKEKRDSVYWHANREGRILWQKQ